MGGGKRKLVGKTGTYVISLKYPSKLLDTLHNNDLDPILFNGILGERASEKIISNHIHPLYSKIAPYSSIGCALSHLMVWKAFLKSENDYAIIFEDDVIIDKSDIKLGGVINKYIRKAPKDFDILYLGCFGSEGDNLFVYLMKLLGNISKEFIVNAFIKHPRVALASHAYILSKGGASKLIDNLDGKIYNHIDFCIQKLSSIGLINRYVTIPRLIYQTSSNLDTVSNNVSNSHPILINNIFSKYNIDKGVKASYITTLSVFRIGSFNITISTILLLILFLFLDIYNYIILIILISLPEIGDVFL